MLPVLETRLVLPASELLGEIEIHQHGSPFPDGDILRLDVHVHDAKLVQIVQRGADLKTEANDIAGRQRSAFVQKRVERWTFDVLEDEIGNRTLEPRFQKPLDRGMRQRGYRSGLACQRPAGSLIQVIRPRQLDCHRSPAMAGPGKPGLAPPPVAQQRPGQGSRDELLTRFTNPGRFNSRAHHLIDSNRRA